MMRVIKDIPYGPHGERNLLDLYLPEGGRGLRAMVVGIHGGGWCSGRKELYAAPAELLAQHGLAAATVNYRIWPKDLWPAALMDVRRAVRWLRSQAKQYRLDPERFGAYGASAGGHLAAFLGLTDSDDERDKRLARFPSRVQCVADFYGPVDFPGMVTSASGPILEGFLGKPYKGNEALYREASPLYFVDAASSRVEKRQDAASTVGPPPFLIYHGTLDVGRTRGEVPIGLSIDLHAKLRKTGGKSTLIKVKGLGHGFAHGIDGPQSAKIWADTVRFFLKHLV
jgi:acetyl esterase/lipase